MESLQEVLGVVNETTPPVQARKNRWTYMSAPGYNPASTKCQETHGGCTGPSRAFFIGGKMLFSEQGEVIGQQERWRCDQGHEWKVQSE